jgi:hypothetical protein
MKALNRVVVGVAVVLVISCLLQIRSARAQDDWQPINRADLALKDNPAQPGADAMILYRALATPAVWL